MSSHHQVLMRMTVSINYLVVLSIVAYDGNNVVWIVVMAMQVYTLLLSEEN